MSNVTSQQRQTIKNAALFIFNWPLKLALVYVSLAMTKSIWPSETFPDSWVAIGISVVLYALIRLQCGFHEELREHDDSRHVINTLKSEIKYALGLIAALFLLGANTAPHALLTFIVFNTVLQLLTVTLSLLTLTALHERSQTNSFAELGIASRKSAGRKKNALVYGTGRRGKDVVDMLTSNPHSDIAPTGFIDARRDGLWSFRDVPLIGDTQKLKSFLLESQVDLIFLAAEPDDMRNAQLVVEIAEEMGAPVCVLPHIFRTSVSACRLKSFAGQPALVYDSSPKESVATWIKEALDRVGSALGLLLALPVMLLTAIAIKLTSHGPVFFKQRRLGKHGAVFNVYKFRSMYCDAENRKRELSARNEMSGPVFKMKNDPRITPLGRFIRKYSIDELPQLFNVFKGDMSLVGPRPALPHEVAKFSPWQRRKLAVKPGVTCIWQVSGRNKIGFEEWMKLDLQYVDNWSLWLDTKILARTIPTVLKGSGY